MWACVPANLGGAFVVQQAQLAQECDDPERRRRRPSASERKTAKVCHSFVTSLRLPKLTLRMLRRPSPLPYAHI